MYCDVIKRERNSIAGSMMDVEVKCDRDDSERKRMKLLGCVQELAEVERRLTDAMFTAAPLLLDRRRDKQVWSREEHVLSRGNDTAQDLLPTPQSMEEVKTILAVARSYASRTSAPSGWNPSLPVVTFATPNPLPHQLRGGALGAMQLTNAKRERRQKTLETQQQNLLKQEDKRRKAAEAAAVAAAKKQKLDQKAPTAAPQPPQRRGAPVNTNLQQQSEEQRKKLEKIQNDTMNLSDSSSDEDDSD